jgi:predicted peptidase
MISTLVILVALAKNEDHVFVPEVRIIEEFEARRYRRPSAKGGQHYNYRLHVPHAKNSNQRHPLILWLHGAHEGGNDNCQQLRWIQLVFEVLPPDTNDYYVLAVQCPSDHSAWFSSDPMVWGTSATSNSVEMITVAYEILEEVISNEQVDVDRVYAVGVSTGATACWEVALRHPDRFAAISPMAARGVDSSRLAAIRNIPIWAFHSLRDPSRPDSVSKSVTQLQALGGMAKLTLVDNAEHGIKSLLHEHDCWTGAIKYYDVMEWLFMQRRGSMFAPPPGVRWWRWWNYFALAIPFAICWLALVLEKKRRSELLMRSVSK